MMDLKQFTESGANVSSSKAQSKPQAPVEMFDVEIALHIGQRNANIRLMRWD